MSDKLCRGGQSVTIHGWGVKGFIVQDDRFLVLVKRNGRLDIPGGRVESGESLEKSLRREITEETCLQVRIMNPFTEWSFFKKPNLRIDGVTYFCRYLWGNVALSHEHDAFFWAKIDDMDRLNLDHLFGISRLYTALPQL